MLLYLLRHANADTDAETDDARVLSEKGRVQALRVACFCEKHSIRVAELLSSPLPRARETAAAVARCVHSEVTIAPWLSAGMGPHQALDELQAYRSLESVMLVGHEPDFSMLAAYLLGVPSSTQMHIRKASLTLIALETFRQGQARLEYSIPCKLM